MGQVVRDPDELAAAIANLKVAGRRIAFANGCFELLHVGHIRYLQAARALADVLVVAVNSDESMRRIKPARRPVNRAADRMEILAALECVSFVVPLTDDTPVALLQRLQPHYHCKGTDYTEDQLPEREIVRSYGGEIRLVGGPKVQSAGAMIQEMRARSEP